jgi:membrane fusion protein, multidrug efflux system
MGRVKLIFLMIIISSTACRNREVKVPVDENIHVKVTEVTSASVSIPIHSTGLIVSSEEYKLSFKTGGLVGRFFVQEGERVKKGKLLASLDLAEINANVSQASNGYEKAQRDFKRVENLYGDTVATLEQKQNAATALNIARSHLEIAQFNLAHSSIYAPDNGLILKELVKENEIVSAGYPVFLFGASGKHWKVKSNLSDRDVVKINPGDSASVTMDAYPGKKFSAVVEKTGEISNPYTGTYELELTLQTTDLRLASGFIASIELFPSGKKSYSMVPFESIVEADGNIGYVYAVKGSGKVQKVKINIETITGSSAAVSGIPAGVSEIVSQGAAYLKDGMKITIIK